jgi:hypothetical protein
MILLNHVLRTRASAAGIRVVVGDPFAATYKRAPYNLFASFPRSPGTSAFAGVPVPAASESTVSLRPAVLGPPSIVEPRAAGVITPAWPSAADCGCEYGAGGKYAESRSAYDPRAEVVCRRCLPFLAAHKVSVIWRDA